MSNKLINLEQFKQLAAKVKTEDDALGVKFSHLAATVEGLVTTGGEANVLEGMKVNGVALEIADKMVDLLIEAGTENGTISVNGAAVAVTGLQALAYKAQISESDLDEALTAAIAAKATNADLEALTVRVTDAEGRITVLESAGFQTAEQVATAVQAAIAEANHLKYAIVDTLPTAEEADTNTWYMLWNEESGHYDIYGLLNGEVRIIDDTTIDLTGYSTTEAMQAYVLQQITALDVDQYATDEELQAVIINVTAIQEALANVYTKEEIDAKLEGYATDDEAAAAASAAVTAAQASDEEVTAALNEVWTPNTGE